MFVNLSHAVGATLTDQQALGTITDDDSRALTLDVDGNGAAEALSDGLLIVRYLFGFTDTELTRNAVDPNGSRTGADEIVAYLDSARSNMLDVDGSGNAAALADGLLIQRYLFGFRGDELTAGAVDPSGTRTDAAAIEAFIEQFLPVSGAAASATRTTWPATANSSSLSTQSESDALVEIHPVIVTQPTAADVHVIPTSISEVLEGHSYVLELWADAQTGWPLSGGFVDIQYDADLSEATNIKHDDFGLLTDGVIDQAAGLIDDLGGLTLSALDGVPQRLGSVEFVASQAGSATFMLRAGKMPLAASGQGGIEWSDVDLGSTNLQILPRAIEPIWQNPRNPLDVTDDGRVAPNDILAGVNAINRLGSRELPLAGDGGAPYLDVNGDNSHTPVDMLIIINALNARTSGSAEGSLISITDLSNETFEDDSAAAFSKRGEWFSSKPRLENTLPLCTNSAEPNITSHRPHLAEAVDESLLAEDWLPCELEETLDAIARPLGAISKG